MVERVKTNVMIIGAGPTGLIAANALNKSGIDYICIEKRMERSPFSKAIGIHARTLEVFDVLGIAEKFVGAGYPGHGAKITFDSGKASLLKFYQLESRFPYLLTIPQNETEDILEEHLREGGGKVYKEHELVSLVQERDHVLVTVNHNGECLEYEAKYVLACDGVHSKGAVRY